MNFSIYANYVALIEFKFCTSIYSESATISPSHKNAKHSIQQFSTNATAKASANPTALVNELIHMLRVTWNITQQEPHTGAVRKKRLLLRSLKPRVSSASVRSSWYCVVVDRCGKPPKKEMVSRGRHTTVRV